jgi:hypothetical protein
MTKPPRRKPAKVGAKKAPPSITRTSSRPVATAPTGYAEWLADVKARVHAAQQRAALAVNRELLAFYWRLGRDIRFVSLARVRDDGTDGEDVPPQEMTRRQR